MRAIDKILKLVPTLSADELQQLQASIKVASSLSAKGSGSARRLRTDIGTDDHHILVMLAEHMRRRGVDYASPDVLMQDNGFQAFKRKVPGIMEFVRKLGGKREQDLVLSMGLGLLYDDLTINLNRAATSKLMMAHIHRVPAMINRQFPGYAQAGMLSLILKGNKDVRYK